MSRLRRLVVSDHWFFITCGVLPGRRILTASEFAWLGKIIRERREKHGFLLSSVPQSNCSRRKITLCYASSSPAPTA